MLRFLVFLLIPTAVHAVSLCSLIEPDLPTVGHVCKCVDAPQASAVTCQINVGQGVGKSGAALYSFDIRLLISVCGTPSIAIYFNRADAGYELFHQFDWKDVDETIRIPDSEVHLPGIPEVLSGAAQMVISGGLSSANVKFAITACVSGQSTCGKGLPPPVNQLVPITIFSGTKMDITGVKSEVC